MTASALPFTLEFDLHGDGDTPEENALDLVNTAGLALGPDRLIIEQLLEHNVNHAHRATFRFRSIKTAKRLTAAYFGIPDTELDDDQITEYLVNGLETDDE